VFDPTAVDALTRPSASNVVRLRPTFLQDLECMTPYLTLDEVHHEQRIISR